MKVYVASKFENKAAVNEAQTACRDLGWTVTHDWTTWDATGLTGGALDAYLEGVLACDVLLLLAAPGIVGAAAELGMALALGKVVVVVDAAAGPRCVFYHHPNVMHAATVAAALERVRAWLRALDPRLAHRTPTSRLVAKVVEAGSMLYEALRTPHTHDPRGCDGCERLLRGSLGERYHRWRDE
jgi:hypothetical protein